MNIDFIFEKFDSDKHQLSNDSLENTKEIVANLSNNIRFEYDKFKKLIESKEFNEFAKKYVSEGQAENKKDMISHLSNVHIQLIVTELKKSFVNQLNVEE